MVYAKATQLPFAIDLILDYKLLIYLGLCSVVASDFIIATLLCFLLARKTSRIRRTKSVIRFLMVYIINTSMLTSATAAICLITYATIVPRMNLVFQAIQFVLPKLYLNSLLAMLNSRDKLRKAFAPGNPISIPLSDIENTVSQSSNGSEINARFQSMNKIVVPHEWTKTADAVESL